MVSLKRLVYALVGIGLLLNANAGVVGVAAQSSSPTSNQFTQMDTVNTDWENDQTIPETYALMGENANFTLHADPASLGFIVVDKRSGYVWHSILDSKAKTDRLNKSWTAFANSGLSIEYLDPKAVNKRLSITNSEHTTDFKPLEQGFEASVTFTEFSITLGVAVHLEADGVRVEVPFDSIKQENPDFKLGLVYVYPFFGATRSDTVPGYMLLPDGVGSLIRFGAETKAKNMFYGPYYGADLGMITRVPYDYTTNRPIRISLPVFGMVHGYRQNAFLSVVEQGAAYGEMQAHPAGIITNFNFLYSAFTYNQSYFQATNRSGDGVTTIQRNTNAFDVRIHYRFLTGTDSDYVGLARSYQRYLVEAGALTPLAESDGHIGLRLEFLGGEKEKFLFWHRFIPMTTVRQMTDIVSDLAVPHPEVVYYGWQPLGATSMPPTSFKLERALGDAAQVRALIETLAAQGGAFSLYVDPQAAVWGEAGYSPRNDLAMSITNANLEGYNRGKVNFFLNWEALNARYSALSDSVFSDLGAGLAVDGFGGVLYGDFKKNHELNREEAIAQSQQLLADHSGPTAFYRPNDYAFEAMRAYYDMPLTTNGYLYTTDCVPFLPIVLAGHVPAYGPALNFSSSLPDDLLRQVDFGVYPAYFLTHDVTAKILNTHSDWIYTSSYGQWEDEVKQTYQWMDSLLGPVSGQAIVARQVLTDGVVATTYANGQQILVNYTAQPFTVEGVTVNGKDALLREVTP